jgi:hypothetical protein
MGRAGKDAYENPKQGVRSSKFEGRMRNEE